MKKYIFLLVLAAIILAAGCAPGVVSTAEQRNRRVRLINQISSREFVDDWDYAWLYDKHETLTIWHPYVGRGN